MDIELCTDTISKIASGRPLFMALSEGRLSLEQRLSQQLHLLSQLSETLTLRLLELEEKLLRLEESHSFDFNVSKENTHNLLEESEGRVRNLQNLLALEKNSLGALDSQPDSSIETTFEERDLLEGIGNDEIEEQTDPANQTQAEVTSLYQEDIDDFVDENNPIEDSYLDDSQMPLLSA